MNPFSIWAKRSKSVVNKGTNDRPTNTTSVPPTASSSTSIPPAVITSTSSQNPIRRDNEATPIILNVGSSKGLVGRNVSHRDIEDVKSHQSSDSRSSTMVAPLWGTVRSAPTTYANNPDMYTQNDLNTFSFGAAGSTYPSSSSSQPVDPLFRPRDEADLDDIAHIPDTTPRPSVVGNVHNRTYPSHSQRHEERSSPSRHIQLEREALSSQKYREPESDTASNFGTSSASASVSSLSHPLRQNHRSTSQVSGRSSDAPLTSLNDSASDEEPEGRHPFAPGALELGPRNLRNLDRESSLYLSEEDFEKYNDETDQDAGEDDFNNEMRPPVNGHNHSNINRESPLADHSERRGSLARDIPGASDRSFIDNIPKNHYSRRPSRSLEELKSYSRPPPGCSIEDSSVPIAPTSIPGSEGNWRELRKKSVQRDKDLPPIFNNPNVSTIVAPSSNASNSVTSSHLDLDWSTSFKNGVIELNASEMADIVNGNQPFNNFRRESSSTYRRQSTISSSVDIFNRRVAIWAGANSKSLKPLWVWSLEKPDEEDSHRQLGDTRERSSISTLFIRPSISNGSDLSRVGSKTLEKVDKEKSTKDKEKASGKDKQKEPWRGMALDSDEIWTNAALGRFRLSRKNAPSTEPGKAPQQRLNVTFLRTPANLSSILINVPIPPVHVFDGPTITIHKHSKANAFSISRHFRRNLRPQDASRNIKSPGQTTTREHDIAEGGRKKTNTMILLAPLRIQKAYTNTNTTQKLESHGLLDESGRTDPRDIARMRREHGREEQQRAKDGDKKKDKGKATDKDSTKRKAESSSSRRSAGSKGESSLKKPSPHFFDASEDSSAGSVAKALSSGDSGMISQVLTLITPDSSAGSVAPQPSILSQETATSDRTIQRTVYRSHQRKRGVYNIDDDDEEEEDSSDGRPKYPTRTPHHETYTTLPPEVLESVRQETQSHGIFGWNRHRSGDRNGHRVKSYLEEPYKPAWPTTQTRVNSEHRKYILEDLNTSFQDVGLLPAVGEIKGSGQISDHKRKQNRDQGKQVKRTGDKQSTDIFEEVPAEALYMLLPLWPGDTDAVSAKNHPYTANPIRTDNRLYLIVYYKNFAKPPPEETSKTKSADKKRSRESPANSADDRSVLLSNFTISARMVSYRELQGTGVRIPDQGLAVFGRLEDAYDTRPPELILGDIILGLCHSHEAGVEFYPEGFDKLNLASHVPYRGVMESTDDDDSQSSETMASLTPIGRAVMEMAWLGAMALTSFNPNL